MRKKKRPVVFLFFTTCVKDALCNHKTTIDSIFPRDITVITSNKIYGSRNSVQLCYNFPERKYMTICFSQTFHIVENGVWRKFALTESQLRRI